MDSPIWLCTGLHKGMRVTVRVKNKKGIIEPSEEMMTIIPTKVEILDIMQLHGKIKCISFFLYLKYVQI